MPAKNPAGLKVIGVFLCLLFLCAATVHNVSADPFPTQDQNPFSLIHGQPQPTSAKLPDENTFAWSLGADITNTINLKSNSQESLFMDFESYLLRFDFIYGLSENWALKINIPFIHYDSGFLDSAIDNWHQLFNLPEGARPKLAKNKFQILYRRNGVPIINLTTPTSGLGDIQLGVGKKLHHDHKSALSIWSSIDIPTGTQSDLTGNDASDVSFWLAAEYKPVTQWSMDTNFGILFPGENNLGALTVEDNVLFGYAAIQWQAPTTYSIRVQLGGHTQFYSNSRLRPLGSAYNLVFGGTIHVSACSDLDIAVSEDIKVEATPDVSFLVNWKSKTGNCESIN